MGLSIQFQARSSSGMDVVFWQFRAGNAWRLWELLCPAVHKIVGARGGRTLAVRSRSSPRGRWLYLLTTIQSSSSYIHMIRNNQSVLGGLSVRKWSSFRPPDRTALYKMFVRCINVQRCQVGTERIINFGSKIMRFYS